LHLLNSVPVAQLLDDLTVGGLERAAVNLANGLAEKGYESHLICSRGAGGLRSSVAEEVQVWCANRTRRWDFAGLRRIADYIDEHNIDLVHSHNHYSSYLTRVVFRFCKRKPLHVVTDQDGPGLHNKKQAFLDRLILRNVDGLVTVTEALRDRAKRLLHLDDSNCIYVINGVDIPPTHKAWEGRPTVVQLANLHWPKDHVTAVRAAAILSKQIDGLRWVCAGRVAEPATDYVREVRDLIGSMGLSETMVLAGEVSDIKALLKEAHVGVLTSEFEALPLSVLEYMAARLPVVMTDVGQGPTIVRSAEAGKIAPAGDAERVAEALRGVLVDPRGAQQMGANGRAYVVEHCSVGAMTQQVHNLYLRLFESRRPDLSVSPGMQ